MAQETRPIPLIIDTDPGVDDATAIMLALSHPEAIDLKLVTSVGGNVELDKTTRNCQVILDFLHAKVPVARGGSAPEATPAEEVHGKDGLKDGWKYALDWKADAEGRTSWLLDVPAVEAQAQVLAESDVPVTIVAIGPLTNVAVLLRKHPELHDKIERIVFMGGAIGRGNKAPYTEFNIGSDPDSAAYVLSAPVPLVMLPLEVADAAVLAAETLKQLGEVNEVGKAIQTLMGDPETGNDQGQETKSMYDPTTIAYLCRPGLFVTSRNFVKVETMGSYTRGATVVYRPLPGPGAKPGLEPTGPDNGVLVCSRVANNDSGDTEEEYAGFAKWLFESVHYWDDKQVG